MADPREQHSHRRVFHWRDRHRHRWAKPILGAAFILLLVLVIYWTAIGACSGNG